MTTILNFRLCFDYRGLTGGDHRSASSSLSLRAGHGTDKEDVGEGCFMDIMISFSFGCGLSGHTAIASTTEPALLISILGCLGVGVLYVQHVKTSEHDHGI